MANIGKKTNENETKRDKFVRLAESRMNNALKQIELLGNLSNSSAYDYTNDDVEKSLENVDEYYSERYASDFKDRIKVCIKTQRNKYR